VKTTGTQLHEKKLKINYICFLRLSALENDFSGVDRSGDFGAILKSPTLLGELLRKAVEASTEYDSDNGNYLN
jgi:hypothetical protein